MFRTKVIGQDIWKRLKHVLFEIRVLTQESVGRENIVGFVGVIWEDDLYDYKIK